MPGTTEETMRPVSLARSPVTFYIFNFISTLCTLPRYSFVPLEQRVSGTCFIKSTRRDHYDRNFTFTSQSIRAKFSSSFLTKRPLSVASPRYIMNFVQGKILGFTGASLNEYCFSCRVEWDHRQRCCAPVILLTEAKEHHFLRILPYLRKCETFGRTEISRTVKIVKKITRWEKF